MANDKDFIVKNAVEVGGSVKVGTGTVTSGTGDGYDLTSASYDGISFSIATQDTVPAGIEFNNDGTSLYVTGGSTDTVYQYSLSTAYDISTASYASKSLYVGGEDTSPQGIQFIDSGSTLLMIGTSSDAIHSYSLTTAYDISTASYDSVSFSVASQFTSPRDFFFKNDGTKLFVVGVTAAVAQYSLTTAYDISTASYDSVSFSISEDTSPVSLYFTSDGTKMFVLGQTNDSIFQYSLSTAWDLSTASYDSVSFSVASEETSPNGMTAKPDGTKFYISGNIGDSLYQYSTAPLTQTLDLSTGNYFSVSIDKPYTFIFSNPAEGQTFHLEVTTNIPDSDYYGLGDYALVAPDGGPDGFSVGSFKTANQTSSDCFGLTFKPDGFKMYVLDSGTDTVYQYSLSDPWDVTGAIYDNKSFSVNSQDGTPYGIAFKTDGTRMYILGRANGDVFQYDLSTAWDVSTAVYNSVVFAIDGQAAAPQTGLDFSPDGTKMYVMDNSSTSSDVYQYTLSTAWDLSTASYASKTFAINDGFVGDFHISQTNGRYAFYTNYTDERVEELKLSTPYDISTATKTGNLYNLYGPFNNTMVSANLLNPAGLYFKPDGSRFFVWNDYTDNTETEDGVFQFDVPDYFYNAPLTWPSNVEWSYEEVEVTPLAPSKEVYTFTTRDTGTTYIGSKSVYGLS